MTDVPSSRLEALATRLLPPVSAEDVLGDLAESSRSDREYLRQFMSVLPRVVWTQVRRRATIGGLVFHGVVAGIGLLAVLAPIGQPFDWLRAAIPWACWVAGCALAAAYGPQGTPVRWNNRVLAAGYLAALGSSAALGLPILWIGAGLASGFAVTMLLAMPWVTSTAPAALSPHTLADHARHFQRLIWWRNARESLAGLVVIGANAAQLRGEPVGLEWTSHALFIVGALWVMVFLHTGAASRVVPNGLSPAALLRFHRDEIARQRRVLRAVPIWYLGPFVPGMLVLGADRWSIHPGAAAGGLVGMALVFGFVWWLNVKAGQSLARQAGEVEALGRHS
jgi:hypothetical protein